MPSVLVCVRLRRGPSGDLYSVWTAWSSAQELMEADRELIDASGCGVGCEGVHVLAWRDGDGRFRIQRGSRDRREPADLAGQLRQLYPRLVDNPPPECWPMPHSFNWPWSRIPFRPATSRRG